MADILGADDKEMLIIDVGNFVRNYPDITAKQVTAMLMARGDMSGPAEAKNHVPDMTPKDTEAKDEPSGLDVPSALLLQPIPAISIFSQVKIS